jgi:hypothetical protein
MVDITTDWTVVDNYEQIQMTSWGLTGTNFVYIIENALRRAPTYRELAASQGKYVADDIVWIVPNMLVAGALASPKVADRILDSNGITYTVLNAALNATRTIWRFMTRNIILAYRLYDTITLQRFSLATDATGAKVYTGLPTVIASNVIAAIQEVDDNETLERGKKPLKKQYSIWVSTPLPAQALDQVIDQNGNVYEVTGYDAINRIDELQRIKAERRGW